MLTKFHSCIDWMIVHFYLLAHECEFLSRLEYLETHWLCHQGIRKSSNQKNPYNLRDISNSSYIIHRHCFQSIKFIIQV